MSSRSTFYGVFLIQQMDDLTTDRSLSQFSQGGEIDYMEDVQLTKWKKKAASVEEIKNSY